MNGERWERVKTTLAESGVGGRLDAQHYQGYPVGGVSYSIFIALPTPGWSVEIRDEWWRKNDKVWLGYRVTLVDSDSIAIKDYPLTKKRSEVTANVKAAQALYEVKV